jgi:hypothetical protein
LITKPEPRRPLERRIETASRRIREIVLTRCRAWYITPKDGDARTLFGRWVSGATIGTIEIFATFS